LVTGLSTQLRISNNELRSQAFRKNQAPRSNSLNVAVLLNTL